MLPSGRVSILDTTAVWSRSVVPVDSQSNCARSPIFTWFLCVSLSSVTPGFVRVYSLNPVAYIQS